MNSAADLSSVIRHLRAPAADASSDTELLDRYARENDQTAFAVLVRRYGALVLGVARRQLADRHRAEDVFQAAFLALARFAPKLGRRPVLANWLYTVALRQARKTRARTARRETVELAAPARPPGADPLAEITARELLQVIDDELARLPDRLRLPVLLCCIQGLSREEAARLLGWSDGAVKGRLERGRRKLAARLAARGLAPSALLLAPLAAVTVPADLFARATEQATAPWAKTVPAAVAELATSAAPRAFLPGAAHAGCVLAVGLLGWAIATGAPNPMQPATPATPPPAVPLAPAANPVPDDPLPAGVTMRFGSPRYRHTTAIESLTVSPDGKIAVACSGTQFYGTARAYDLSTGRVLFALDGVRDVEAVAFSPDGKMIASRPFASEKRAIHLHDAVTGKAFARIPSHCAPDFLAFSPDSKRILVADVDRKALHLVDIAKGEAVETFEHTGTVFAAAFAPDGKHVVGGGYEKENGTYVARLWDVNTGKEARRFEFGKWGIRCLVFSADGSTLAIGGDYGKPLPAVKLFDVATGKERLAIPFPDASGVRSVAFSPNGKSLAASGGSVTRLFDTATGKELVKIDRRASGLRFAPDGRSFVGAVAGTIYRWDATTGKSLIPEGGDSPVGQIAVTPDGRRIVSRGYDGDAHIWDARTGEHLRRVNMSWHSPFALSPDGRFLVWPGADETLQYKVADEPNTLYTGTKLRMIDVSDGTFVERFAGFEGGASELFFTPDGKALVTIGHPDSQVRFWNMATGKVERSFSVKEPGARATHSRPSPDGKVLAVSYQKPRPGSLNLDYTTKVWDLASGKELDQKPGHWADHNAMAIAPDGKTIAVAFHSGTIQFRDAVTGEVRKEIRVGPLGGVTALAFGPDGQLFSGTPDATVLAWGKEITKPPAERK